VKRLSAKYTVIILATALLVPCKPVHANPLSAQSKNFMLIAAAVGGTIGGALGIAMYADAQRLHPSKPEPGLWGKFKELMRLSGYILVPAAIGAAVVGGGSYFFTYEKYAESAANNLIGFENDSLAQAVNYGENNIDALKREAGVSGRFSTVALRDRLKRLYDSLKTFKNDCVDLLQSGIDPVVKVGESCIESIKPYLESVSKALNNIENSKLYSNEKIAQLTEEKVRAEFQRDVAITANLLNNTKPPIIITRSVPVPVHVPRPTTGVSIHLHSHRS
jgi:hypothetical protein